MNFDHSLGRNLRLVPALLIFSVACSSSPEERGTGQPEPAPATAAAAPVDAGPHTVNGTLPAAIGGFPSIVILESQSAAEAAPPPVAPYMDQIQQNFIPAVLMVQTGQPVQFRNSDDVLHNVRVSEDATHSPAFNVAIPTGEAYTFTFPRDGFYDVGCDIHPGMAAQVVATRSPYTAVADNAGTYSIAGVPGGSYKAVVYTGTQKIERELMVAGGQTRFDVTP